ncbi:UDP-N-acetylhexosamine pyrophosphorylase AltName: Full=Antigen X; Short=AGX; AltName: Full=Sperm-associated antigen 2; Includes: RecName: Full=UDP-N-acetylgalactosamine pyrophosphorylase; AltName: Full=AGX-1; Includes: RecName: Full=UDP-N-acetylglucosamine pyrophosphorylase; AltName: Full=AGX-2 [Serendipita indica DSM 11827]|uniref:UDP-N-acetylglucosamine diphosphorylase n=1 Tax=Serendipita indica (strain DSM 11827) TaxID=1109443 RepID=G4TPM0_SERID|nr:UDP-N-acetylhexosamine pyrophosphorylase AltName: Full=Antigen X; Short=AGX; AltName: Full=Sperm-associated antigen 2; Includes: RecName: Full=UDP-N-acetylgalactosamine pyrophosphorylase; AltName: Full=AGX-1; Includes: RecName: Full=UDP-N-acetylglucosamine pyrophosphorylase; AltName: Full=AGX-2 [Serendipita indica DSM 11827]CCA73263.1 probable UDP-N-acetylglucosamine pyrophosphorylase [Serendipita indica DSM 11827]
MPTLEKLQESYAAADQSQVFRFLETLNAEQRQTLIKQLAGIDIQRVNRIYQRAIEAEKYLSSAEAKEEAIEPLPSEAFDSTIGSPSNASQWREAGLDAIAKGQVGVLLMAGGQGTRLGSSAPKGCYDIGLPSHKSLFQYQAERIRRLQDIAKKRNGKSQVVIPWYVMTSGPTRPDTVAFFKANNYFGLNPSNVIFFEQGTLPCLTMDGKVIMDAPDHIAVAPDGNGGLYAALRSPLNPGEATTVLSDMGNRNVLYVHAYGVDNCLVRVADPTFIGFCLSKKADCAAKVVRKVDPKESVGVVALKGKKYSIVEYSEISAEDAESRDSSGELKFRAANIANHFYTTEFLRSVVKFEDEMAFHIARKKIPHIDMTSGQLIKPSKPNGLKLELFVFDVFPFTSNFAVLEVDRKDDFSPLKNAPGTGVDDPETSRRDLLQQQRRFLEAAGATVAEGVEIELSPLVTYDGEGLESVKGKKFTRSGIVESIESLDALV